MNDDSPLDLFNFFFFSHLPKGNDSDVPAEEEKKLVEVYSGGH